MKYKTLSTLSILTLIYAALYVFFVISFIVESDDIIYNADTIIVYSLFIFFIIGLVFSWYNKLITGLIFICWNIIGWIMSFFIIKEGGGFLVISGYPLLVLGAFHMLDWHNSQNEMRLSKARKWKYILQVLTVSYFLLYCIVVAEGFVINTEEFSLFTWPGLILILLLLIFLAGFILSWRYTLISGILFIFWYAVLFDVLIMYPEIGTSGPWFILGVSILAQGVLNLVYYFKIRDKIPATGKYKF